ncbi:hypothetical protein VTN96DRAFT_10444 [Rasamsonia emersonii]
MSPFLPNFDVLSPSVYLQRSSSQQSSSNDPDYIVLLTWMHAKAEHILKYVQGYSRLFPTARIMIITTTASDMIVVSFSTLQRRLEPAIQVLASRPEAKVLIHLFSNGGAHMTAQLALTYSQRFHKPLPVQAMVFDSSPGQATWQRSARALIAGFPKQPLARILGTLVVHLALALIWISLVVFPRENVVTISTGRSQQSGLSSPGGPSMLPLFGSG